jgi:PEGA domain
VSARAGQRSRLVAAVLVCALVPGGALADRSRVAVAPITSLTEGAGSVASLDQLIEAAIATVPERDVVSAAAVKQLLRRAKRRDLESCEGEPACLAELGKLAGASIVIAGEASAIGEDQVVYLRAIDVARATEVGSTTLVTAARATGPVAAQAARAAAYRLLAPRDYAGTLALRIDAAHAVVFVDGQRVGESPLAPLTLPVGTHALRVTHPSYRDFVRFIEVKFGERTDLVVDLSPYSVVADTLRQDASALAPRRPWYRSPWALVGAGAALVVVTAIIVALAVPPSPTRDADVTVMVPK